MDGSRARGAPPNPRALRTARAGYPSPPPAHLPLPRRGPAVQWQPGAKRHYLVSETGALFNGYGLSPVTRCSRLPGLLDQSGDLVQVALVVTVGEEKIGR